MKTKETTTYKGYELLTMLTRRQQREWFKEVGIYNLDGVEYRLYKDYETMRDFIYNSFILTGTDKGFEYWYKICSKHSI